MPQNFQPDMGPSQMVSGVGGPASPWVGDEDAGGASKKSSIKWEAEEVMGDQASISCVLYVNMVHPELKQKYPGEVVFFFSYQGTSAFF